LQWVKTGTFSCQRRSARLGLVTGSHLLISAANDSEEVLRVVPGEVEVIEKDGLLVLRGVTPADMLAAEEGDREARLNALSPDLGQ